MHPYLHGEPVRLAWVAFVLLIPVVLLGFIMLMRWIPVYQGRAVTAGAPRSSARAGSGPAEAEPAERHLPVPVVVAHGLFAVVVELGNPGADRIPGRENRSPDPIFDRETAVPRLVAQYREDVDLLLDRRAWLEMQQP